MAGREDLLGLLKRVAELLNTEGFNYALAGGLALGMYLKPRATVDIDILILLREGDYERIRDLLKESFERIISHPAPMSFKNATIWRNIISGGEMEITLDFIVADNEFYKNALSRVSFVALNKIRIPVVSPEDLVIMKSMAGRAQDMVDTEEMMKKIDLDRHYIKVWAEKLGLQT